MFNVGVSDFEAGGFRGTSCLVCIPQRLQFRSCEDVVKAFGVIQVVAGCWLLLDYLSTALAANYFRPDAGWMNVFFKLQFVLSIIFASFLFSLVANATVVLFQACLTRRSDLVKQLVVIWGCLFAMSVFLPFGGPEDCCVVVVAGTGFGFLSMLVLWHKLREEEKFIGRRYHPKNPTSDSRRIVY